MRIELTDQTLHIRLSWWEKLLGLMKDIRLAREQITEVRVVEDPMREAMRSGLKAGLRLPWLLFVARTLRLDQAFVVRRRQPGLSICVRDHGALRRVLVSTPRARELARELLSPRVPRCAGR